MNRIPFIVFGDGPRNPTGLARIARDLASRLFVEQEELGIRLCQVGVDDPQGWHFQAWDFYGFQPTMKDYGRGALETACLELYEQTGEEPIVLPIFDPSRVWDLVRPLRQFERVPFTPKQIWGYFPIDAHNPQEMIGGPAAQAVIDVDRVLGYGKYGATVLKKTLDHWNQRTQGRLGSAHGEILRQGQRGVQYLPHGIDTRTFTVRNEDEADPLFQEWYAQLPPETYVIGCVATNQPRKDLGLLFATVAELKTRGYRIGLWLHTDDLNTGAWDVGELAQQFMFRKEEVLATFHELPDIQLAARYSNSHVTIAPGLGEGFGYPIVESLACGTPPIHLNYAGGVELIPSPEWVVEPSAWRLESIYALMRPVGDPKRMADAVQRVLDRPVQDWGPLSAYCRGSVAHLDWQHLWPRWRHWIETGLRDERTRRAQPRSDTARTNLAYTGVDPAQPSSRSAFTESAGGGDRGGLSEVSGIADLPPAGSAPTADSGSDSTGDPAVPGARTTARDGALQDRPSDHNGYS